MIRGAFPPITNRQSLIDRVEVYSDYDNTLFDLTGATIVVSIGRDLGWLPAWGWGGDYYYDDWPGFGTSAQTASTDDGTVVIAQTGIFVFTFTRDQIATLCPGQYVLGLTMSRDGVTVQILLATFSVLDGVVPR